jgi:hypothetical protein
MMARKSKLDEDYEEFSVVAETISSLTISSPFFLKKAWEALERGDYE